MKLSHTNIGNLPFNLSKLLVPFETVLQLLYVYVSRIHHFQYKEVRFFINYVLDQ